MQKNIAKMLFNILIHNKFLFKKYKFEVVIKILIIIK